MKTCIMLLRRAAQRLIEAHVPGAGLEPARPKSRDFKSRMSTNSITRA